MKKYLYICLLIAMTWGNSFCQNNKYLVLVPTFGGVEKSCDTTKEWIISQNCFALRIDTINAADTNTTKQQCILVPYDSAPDTVHFSIKGFTLLIKWAKDPPETLSMSNCLTSDQTRQISSLQKGTKIFFEQFIIVDNVTNKEYRTHKTCIMIKII